MNEKGGVERGITKNESWKDYKNDLKKDTKRRKK